MSDQAPEYRTVPTPPALPAEAAGPKELPSNIVPLGAEHRAAIRRYAEAATPGPFKPYILPSATVGPICSVVSERLGYEISRVWKSADSVFHAAIDPNLVLGTLAYVEHLEAENQQLTARLHQEQQDAADQAAQLLVLHEEARKLQGDVQDMNRQIGEAHRATSGWIEECGKRTEGRKAAEQGLQDFKESTLAGLKEAYGQGEWLNVHYIIEELKEELSAASLPVQGEPVEGKEVGQNG